MDNMTAKVSCFARAYHRNNSPAPIFDDTTAEALLGEDYSAIAGHMTAGIPFFLPGFNGSPEEGLARIVNGQLAPSVLARSAFCEDHLSRERRLGCSQAVLFAAGYDTLALRNTDPALMIYEMDLPELIEDKERRITSAALSPGAVYIPCDLADPSWAAALEGAGFQRRKRAFGTLLGISYYLTKEDFRTLLSTIGTLWAEGSSLCFDYPMAQESQVTAVNKALAAGAGETMKAAYTYRELEMLLSDCDFLIYEHLDPAEMTRRYFEDHNRKDPDSPMEAPEGVAYVLAVRKA